MTELVEKQRWRQQAERGSTLLMRIMMQLSLALGRPLSRIILYPICAYFFLTGRAGRRASRDYLTKALDRKPRLADVFRHYYFFASTILDRVFFLAQKFDAIEIEVEGKEAVDRVIARHGSCLYLGAHLGSFEAMRALGTDRGVYRVNVLMYEDNAQKISKILYELAPEERTRVIPLGGLNSLIFAKDCIDRGERLAILGDRIGFDQRMIEVPFFGEDVLFPSGPISLAGVLRIPVVIFFGLYLGRNRYRLCFELFDEDASLPRKDRDLAIKEKVTRYAERLEHYCKLAPYNWFNFYDFWGQGRENIT